MINLLLFFLAAQWVPSSLSSASFGQVIPGKIQSPGACRTKSGSSGDKYIDYDVMKAKSQYQCATACSENDKCNGWEWSESSGACEIWWNYAPEYEALDGYSCFMKDTYSSMRFSGYPVSAGRVLGGLFNGYSGHVDAACRTSSGENGDRGDEYDREDDFDDKYECANECTKKSNCRGFEWNDDNKRCELWWEYAPRYERKDDFYCFMKDTKGDDYYYNNYEGYSGAVCRTSNYMTGSNGNEYDVEYNVDMHECMDMCSKSRNCYGWEWSRSRKQCELWKEYAPKHVKAEDNYCFMKQRTDRD
eukprot:CAMPEP_0172477798 /NCGR_PEP_ID=MMETSP1066-20121228/1252_1 /TAXON_ID=671091 /ORGANISM="Coscinodiscus wailesii, Strain CCMP2513" /LENGTH=302 /DNA_ID=CAMNT_0013236699 /DNA_START=191 /DNA_END=1099 /DNA_ORIENTATION=+